MANYKDTAELEYKGVDNLSKTIERVSKQLDSQREKAQRTEDRIDKYTDRLKESAAVSQKSAKMLKVYSEQLEKERAEHKNNIAVIAEATHKRDQLKNELNSAKVALNNLSKEEKENADLVAKATARVKEADAAYIDQQKAVLELKDDQSKLNQSINETQRAYNKTLTAQERARTNSQKMTAAIKEQEIALDKQNRSMRELNVEILQAGGKTAKATAAFVNFATKIEDLSASTLEYGDKLNKLDGIIDKVQNSTKKLNKDTSAMDKRFDKMRESVKKTQTNYVKYKSTIEKVNNTSKKIANVTAKLGVAFTKATKPVTKMSSAIKKSAASTGKQSTAFGKLSRSSQKANKDLTKTNSLLGKISKMQTLSFGLQIASSAANSLKSFMAMGDELADKLLLNDNLNKQYNSTLGEQTKVMDEIYETQLRGLGISRADMQATSARLAQQAENYNMTKEAAAEFAVMGTELGSVLSVTNLKQLDMADSSDRLISALRGEAEASEMLGLNLNATKMAAYTEEIKARGAAYEGTFNTLGTAEQSEIRMMAAIEQTAVITGASIDPIYDLETANIALNKILLETGDSLTDSQKAALKWKIAVNEIKEAGRGTGTALMNIMSSLLSAFGKVMKSLRSLVGSLLSAFEWIASNISNLVGIIVEKISSIAKKVKPYVQAIVDVISNTITPVISNVKSVFTDLWSVVEGIFGSIMEAFSGLGGETSGVDNVSNTMEKIVGIVAMLTSYVSDLVSKFKDWVTESEVLQKITDGISKIFTNYVKPVIEDIISIFSDWWAIIKEFFKTVASGVGEFNILGTILGIIKVVFIEIWEAAKWLWDVLANLVGIIREFLVEGQGMKFLGIVFGILVSVIKDVISVAILLWDVLKPIVNFIVKLVMALLPLIIPLIVSLVAVITVLWKILVVVVKVILKIVGVLLNFLTPIINVLMEVLQKITMFIAKYVVIAFNFLIKLFLSIYKIVQEKVVPIIRILVDKFREVVSFIRGKMKEGFDVLKELFNKNVVEPITKVIDWIKKFIDKMKEIASVIYEKIEPGLTAFGEAITKWIIDPVKKAIDWVKDLIGWFKDLITVGGDAEKATGSAGNSAANKAQEIGNSQKRAIEKSVRTSVEAYGNISKPVPMSMSSTSYNSTRNNVSFTIAGGYRKSLAALQRDAQVIARRKGVPLR